jgi:AraC family transcriptional regulator
VSKEADNENPLPHNILSVKQEARSWSGVRLEVTRFQCKGEVYHRLTNEKETRLSVVLEEIGSPCEPRLQKNKPCPIEYRPRHMHFAPAGVDMWGFASDARFVKDATLVFDPVELSSKFGIEFDTSLANSLRLRFWDDPIWQLVKLLSDVVNDHDPTTQLYGDGITNAILARLLTTTIEPSRKIKTLAPWQTQLVTEYLYEHLPKHVELPELAALINLSPSHFSRAFKASTGMAPYRWQLDARIRQAQVRLINTNDSLQEVAEATGFADAVHFGRTFRRLVGATPGAWRQERKL